MLVASVLFGALISLASLCSMQTRAQSSECWPEMDQVHSSMRDVVAIRKAEEEQVRLLRQLLHALEKRP
jgi:hypothetical protein